MSSHEHYAHAFHSSFTANDWRPWADEVPETLEGPGLLVSRAFWIGGGLSLVLWAGVTMLALQWL